MVNGNYMSFGPGDTNMSPYDTRQYWTPERKRNATPTPIDTMPDAIPDAANFEPATDPKQADLSIMPFTAAGKLFYTLDGKD